MKYYNLITILSISILLLAFAKAYICQDETDLSNLPCEVVTPLIYCSGDANVSELSNLANSIMVAMTLKTTDIYNFSFPYSNASSYQITLCDNSTATMETGNFATDYNDKWLWFYIFTLGIAVALFIFGFNKEDNILTLLSGFIFIAFAITFISVGYPTLTNQTIKNSIILITLGIGAYITMMSSFELIKGGE